MKVYLGKRGGITLIALVVTIIVLLILAAVSLNLILGQNGIISRSKDAVNQYGKASQNEQAQMNETEKWFENELAGIGNENETILDIFDPTGEVEEKLHVGDFIDYDAGIWTAEEISEIKVGVKGSEVVANGSTLAPTGKIQFGGFSVGDSRNTNATPYDINYTSTSDGWRIFDIDEVSGIITLISAGCPEDYNHMFSTNGGYISEYILTGNINSNKTSLNLDTTYTKRDWSNYINSTQYATSAMVVIKKKLDDWYSKYMGYTDADIYTSETFHSVDNTKYETLICNNTYYWIATSTDDATNVIGYYRPVAKSLTISINGRALGVRVMVTLSSDVKVHKTPTTRIITSSGTNYKYNVWSIK